MYKVQEDIEVKRISGDTHYIAWVNVSEEWKETEVVYIFTDLYRHYHFDKTEEAESIDRMKKFVEDTKIALVEKLYSITKNSKQSIFDYPRHRIVFLSDTNNLKLDNWIGYTWDAELDKKVLSYPFQSPESFLSYING